MALVDGNDICDNILEEKQMGILAGTLTAMTGNTANRLY